MNNQKIISILSSHGINTKIANGNLYAEEVYTLNRRVYSEWINVTSWKYDKLYAWLGY